MRGAGIYVAHSPRGKGTGLLAKTLQRLATTTECFLCGGRDSKVRWTLPTFSVRTCSECGLVFSDLVPSQQSIRDLYQDEYFEPWKLAAESNLPTLRRMKHATFRRYLECLGALVPHARPPAKVLDVGCAAGFLLEVAMERGYEPYGVELSRFAAAMAEDTIGPGRIYCGRLEDVDWPPETFDVIFLCDLLEHLPDPMAALGVLRRLTRPRGILFVVTPDVGSLSAKIMGKHWTNVREEHLVYLDKRTAGRLLGQAGYHLIAVEPATKVLNAKYVLGQFEAYHRPLLTPLVRLLRCLPTWLQTRNFRIPSGDMILVAIRAEE